MIELVEAMKKDASLSPAVRRAFLTVDRGLFVPSYYEHEGMQWVRQANTPAVVYQNRPLVTQIDSSGIPSSSSSQPSIMAEMLDALTLWPGQRVLEIGTGTGYNAALLCHLVGDNGQVVSLDIDKALVQQAQAHLQAAGFDDVALVVANGLTGYEPLAPYDRVIVTGGFRSLPAAWREHLSPRGVLVGNLLGSLTPVLLRLVKVQDNLYSGSILPQDAFFMELRGHSSEPAMTFFDWSPYDMLPAEETYPDGDLASLLLDRTFLFYLQLSCPALLLQMRHDGKTLSRWLLETDRHTSLHVPTSSRSGGSVQVRGDLLPLVFDVYQRWQHLGRPSLADYRLEMESGDLFACLENEHWRLAARAC